MGDFNINLLNVGKHRDTEKFLDMMFASYLFPYITHPTRFDKKLQSTLIDNIFHNTISENCISGNLISHISDHLPNFLIIQGANKPQKYVKNILKRNFKHFDIHEFRYDLTAMKLENKLKTMVDPNKMYDYFHNGISILLDIHCPIERLSNNQIKRMQKPWINDSILKKISKKNSFYGEFLQTGNPDILREYKTLRNEINHDIRKNKFIHKKNKFESVKSNTKKLWREINNTLGKTKHNDFPQTMFRGKNKLCTTKKISKNFNEHFADVAANLLNKLKPGEDPIKNMKPTQSSMFFTPTTSHEINTLINQLDIKKAIDIYNFPIPIIKNVSDLISVPISLIINESVSKGLFPEKLKLSKVIPILKRGDIHNIENYRPISILPLFDKIFEKIVHKRLMKYLDDQNILFTSQFGFQKGKSTADAVLKLTNEIHTARMNKEVCCAILLDLAKAFDTVNHKILLRKLNMIGIRGPLNNWFESYLCNRKQSVIINREMSPPTNMEFGVPQGSVLGPTLFLIYINDMPRCAPALKYTLFADDTCLSMSHKDPKQLEILINNELKKVNQWLLNNRLSLNVSKSCSILFSGNKKIEHFNVSISDNLVKRVSIAKYLGVFIDENLNWKHHLAHVLTKIKQGSGIINKLSHLLSPYNLPSLYYSFIQSHIQYCITSWGSPTTKCINKLNQANRSNINKINKICTNNQCSVFKPLNVQNLYKLESCKLIHKHINNKTPSPLKCLFNKPHHNRITRHSQLNSIATIHFELASAPITFYGPQFWNRNCLQLSQKSHSSFSHSLKKRLFLE